MERPLYLYFTLFFSITSLIGCKPATENRSIVSDSLRAQAIEQLRDNLTNLSQWEKVHAAEYLLWSGYPQDVKRTFEQELQLFEHQSPYRIGIWRVLAQASQKVEDKRFWANKIQEVFADLNAKDRIHAAETLAKLRTSPTSELALQDAVNSENINLSTYSRWAELYGPADSIQTKKSDFIQGILHQDAQARNVTAYAVSQMGELASEEWKQLANTALSEPDDSPAKVNLLCAALITAPQDSTASEAYHLAKAQLLQPKVNHTATELSTVVNMLAQVGTTDELPMLTEMLDMKSESSADLRSSAAYAILSIDGRQNYSLATLDWTVIALYLLGMLVIGFVFSMKNKSEKDFLLGGGNMNPVAVGLSLFATLLSSLSYLSYPGEAIKYGPVIFTGLITFPLVYYLVGWFMIPKFMNMNVTSAYEILEIRLGVNVRMLATFFFLSLRFLWMGTIIYVTVNTAILTLFDLDPDYTLLISALLMIITIVYTSLGGLKAVVATDVIQSIVLLGGAIVAIVAVSIHFGSFTSWIPLEWLPQWGEFKWGIDAQERLTFGNAIIMVFIWQVCSAGSDQMAIQRYLATKDIRSARKTFGISLLTNMAAQLLLGLVGIAMIAYFMKNPHYLPNGKDINEQADLLFPRFILVGLPVGLSGLITAGIFAAAMSSLSSGLNSSSSVISEDLIKRFSSNPNNVEKALKRVKYISLGVGIFTLLLSILVSKVEGNLYDIIVKVVNLFVTPLFVLFFMALFIPFATSKGTLAGGILSLAAAIAVAFYGFLGIEVLFITPTALIVGILGGVLFSYIDVKILGNQDNMQNRQKARKQAQLQKIEEHSDII